MKVQHVPCNVYEAYSAKAQSEDCAETVMVRADGLYHSYRIAHVVVRRDKPVMHITIDLTREQTAALVQMLQEAMEAQEVTA